MIKKKKFRQRKISVRRVYLPFFFMALTVLLIVGTFFVNRWIMSSVERLGSLDKMPSTVFEPRAAQHSLTPDDLKKFHILSSGKHDLTLTQKDWDSRMARIMQNSSPDVKMKEGARDISRKLKVIDRQIKYYEQLAKTKSADFKARENLQTLYMLRATLLAVQNKEK